MTDDSQARAPVFQPGKLAGVELHEGTPLGLGRPPGTARAGAPPALGGQPERPTQAAHRAATEPQALHLLQFLGDMAIVQPRVGFPEPPRGAR